MIGLCGDVLTAVVRVHGAGAGICAWLVRMMSSCSTMGLHGDVLVVVRVQGAGASSGGVELVIEDLQGGGHVEVLAGMVVNAAGGCMGGWAGARGESQELLGTALGRTSIEMALCP